MFAVLQPNWAQGTTSALQGFSAVVNFRQPYNLIQATLNVANIQVLLNKKEV
jgi:hypothetical protein